MNVRLNQEKMIKDFLKQRDKEETLFYFDIDNFSLYNKTNSFEKGNLILEKLCFIFKSSSFVENWLKIDSDEFLIRCNGNFDENKQNIVELLNNINEKLNITFSIGATDKKFNSYQQKFIYLKSNLLMAKQLGKNKIYYI